MRCIVVDANVIAKTFVDEIDSQQALAFLAACVSKKTLLVAPELLKYELAQIAIKKALKLEAVAGLINEQLPNLIEFKSPSQSAWLQAEKICQTGHVKSGFPSLYDSVYHAMAIVAEGMFVTADKRHYEKSKTFGHIVLLKDWQAVID